MKKNQSNITSEKIGLFEKIAYGGVILFLFYQVRLSLSSIQMHWD